MLVGGLALIAFGAYFGERLLARLPQLHLPAKGPAETGSSSKAAPGSTSKPVPKSRPKPLPRAASKPPAEAGVPAGPAAGSAAASSAPSAAPLAGQPKARVAIVIDDLGRDVGAVEKLAALTGDGTAGRPAVQLSFAVLPFESRTREVVEALRRHGAEILVHLPMDPEGSADPGPGALTAGMSRRALVDATEAALAAVRGASGVNNHMGSQITAERSAMEAILGVVHRHRLYYLDSRTTSESVGFEVARAAGIPAAARDFFLDDEPGRDAVAEQFARLLARAREQGVAIAIAHPHPATLAVLAEEIPRAAAAGFEFVPVSYLLERDEEDAE